MHCSIVIPVQDEEENVAPLLKEISSALQELDNFEVIYVDDHSTDRTLEILQNYQGIFPWLRIVRLSQHYGQSVALCHGIDKSRYPLIVTLDGDCQNDPADIQKFVDEYHRTKTALNSQKTCCLVIGHRLLRRDTGWRKFSSYTAKIARRSLLGDDTPDSGCGLKAFSRETFMTLPRFNHMHRFLPTLIKQRGGEVVSMAVNHRERLSGNSHYGTLDRLFVGLDDLMGVLWLGRRAIPPNTISEDY